jgi:hypothetical protein
MTTSVAMTTRTAGTYSAIGQYCSARSQMLLFTRYPCSSRLPNCSSNEADRRNRLDWSRYVASVPLRARSARCHGTAQYADTRPQPEPVLRIDDQQVLLMIVSLRGRSPPNPRRFTGGGPAAAPAVARCRGEVAGDEYRRSSRSPYPAGSGRSRPRRRRRCRSCGELASRS